MRDQHDDQHRLRQRGDAEHEGTTASVDCDGCPGAGVHCEDCAVAFILGRAPNDAVVVDLARPPQGDTRVDPETDPALGVLRSGGLFGAVVEQHAIARRRVG